MYDACVKRHMYKGKFEFTYVSKSAVIVKTLKTGMRIVLKSVYGYEIEKINIYQDRQVLVVLRRVCGSAWPVGMAATLHRRYRCRLPCVPSFTMCFALRSLFGFVGV